MALSLVEPLGSAEQEGAFLYKWITIKQRSSRVTISLYNRRLELILSRRHIPLAVHIEIIRYRYGGQIYQTGVAIASADTGGQRCGIRGPNCYIREVEGFEWREVVER